MWSNNDGMDPTYKPRDLPNEGGNGPQSYQSILEQFILLRAAVVYARQALSIPETKKESEAAIILERARKESDDIMKRYQKVTGA